MRPIDGDALADVLTAISSIKVDTGWSEEWAVTVSAAAQAIAQMPTIEPKKGKWIPITKGERGYSAGDFRCSVCHQPNKCYIVTNYCSHCGALMKEDK